MLCRCLRAFLHASVSTFFFVRFWSAVDSESVVHPAAFLGFAVIEMHATRAGAESALVEASSRSRRRVGTAGAGAEPEGGPASTSIADMPNAECQRVPRALCL